MVNGRHDASDDLALLDEWHVSLVVERSIADDVAEDLRARVEAELQAWADQFGPGLGSQTVHVRVKR
jgi:hypothetical protein